MTRTRWVGLVTASAIALALAGCSSPHEEDSSPKPIPEPTMAIDSPEEMCGVGYTTPPVAPSSTLWLRADGAWFHSGLVGTQTDTTVAVFVHQSNLGFCGWFPYAQYLAKHGVRSILLNLCGFGVTLCPTSTPVMESGAQAVLAAARWARADGATRVVAVGASMGGTVTVLAASEDSDHQLDALADLSGPIIYLDANTTFAASTITVASFFAVAPSDRVVSVYQMETLAGEISSPTPILHLDGDGHGWGLLHNADSAGPFFDPLAEQLASFIEGTPPTN
jgi:fermentation-respiration switch protein FrsA (DUF1100 family)